MEIQRLQEQERRLAQDLARAQEQNTTLVEDNRSLASQLVLYQEDAKATSETLVIKDAEVDQTLGFSSNIVLGEAAKRSNAVRDEKRLNENV